MVNLEGHSLPTSETPRLIAFYLTQYHPIPENDAWWGKGFTEWSNVTKARPLFEGHYQPHLPSDLGFYDLRLRETRREQIALAKEYGIDGFCYHYYWFSGKRLLERPLDDMLSDPESDMPFCLCWANESWSRRWSGEEKNVLMPQHYHHEDDLAFIQSLQPYFADPRYIRLENKPFLIVYRPTNLPDPKRSTEIWRAYCRESGIGEIHLCAALTFGNEVYAEMGFDSGVEFPPHNSNLLPENDLQRFYAPFWGRLYDYTELAQAFLNKNYLSKTVFKTLVPAWDNTARMLHHASIFKNSSPGNYEYWLSKAIDQVKDKGTEGAFIFVNAWNEWAEGCHLEPDMRYGRAYLEATQRAKNGIRNFVGFPDQDGEGYRREQHFSIKGFCADLARVFSAHGALLVRSFEIQLFRIPTLRHRYLQARELYRVQALRLRDWLQRPHSRD
jgi:lipopolysaccharide biosynthesis protein